MENVIRNSMRYGEKFIHLCTVCSHLDLKVWYVDFDSSVLGILLWRQERFIFYPMDGTRPFSSKHRYMPIIRFLDLKVSEKLQKVGDATGS